MARSPRARKDGGQKGESDIRAQGQDLVQLVIAYVKQETIDPVRNLGRYLGYGLAGSLAMAIGMLLVLLGILRLLQEQTGTVFDGRLSFVPYLVTLVACIAAAGLVMTKAGSAGDKEG